MLDVAGIDADIGKLRSHFGVVLHDNVAIPTGLRLAYHCHRVLLSVEIRKLVLLVGAQVISEYN
jgi:hypothetical protein